MSTLGLDPMTVERLAWTLLHFAWQGTAVALLHGLTQALMRRQSSARRYLAACTMLVLSLACVMVTFMALKPVLEPVAPVSLPVTTPVISAVTAPVIEEVAVSTPDRVLQPVSAVSRPETPWQTWAVIAWMTGVLALSARLGLGWLGLRRLRRHARVLGDALWLRRLAALSEKLGVKRAVSLMTSTTVDSPMTMGWWRPVIVLPASMLAGIPREQMEMILAHELAHIRRGDFIVHAMQCGIETLLFFHPVVWWIGADLRRLREECCDDLALRCGQREDLARALLSLEQARLPALAQGAAGSSALARVRRLLGVSKSPAPRWKGTFAGVLVCVLLFSMLLRTAFAAEVIQVKPGESIQAALDAAPEGAVIKIAAGVYAERITITKPVTLEGAGDGKTILRPDKPEPGVTPETAAAALKKWQEASTDDDRLKFELEYSNKIARPTLIVEKTQNIVVRGLRIQGMAPKAENDTNTGAVLARISSSSVEIEDCMFIGPYSNGVSILEDAKVRMSKSLVAAIWGTGVVIDRGLLGKGTPPIVDIEDCDIRNCYHRCITIGTSCDDVRIRRCLISGSAWHGIRYDHASPVIEQNIIFANARSGIYASGETHAKVTGNLFHGNEMGGVSCWFANRDTFERNTFAGNLREGVSVLGASKPVFLHNIFAHNPVGIVFNKISNDRTKATGEADLKDNVFWMNGKFQKPPAGTREADPKFVDVTARDFRLAADSPMRAEKIGAADLPSPNSPWPLQTEEKAMVPATSTRNYSDWQKPGKPNAAAVAAEKLFMQARTDCDPWVKDALQIDSIEKRRATIDTIRAGISSSDLLTQLKAIIAFNRISVVEFDRQPFRAPLLPLLESTNVHLSIGACRALKTCGYQAGDLARMLKLAATEAPPVLENITPYLVEAAKDKLLPGMEPVLLKVLSSPMIDLLRAGKTGEGLARDTMSALGRLDLSPPLKSRVLELSRETEPRVYRLAFHHAYAPQKMRTKEDVSTMASFLEHEDSTVIVPRALWAFEQGTSDALKPQTAGIMTQFIEARADATLRMPALKVLSAVAGPAQLEFCEKRLKKPGLPAEERQALEAIIARLKTKK
ncbi:MAG: right-handed parallel beta-helix repeat-containing protein [Verrucomicrobiaceae bacterium]|nr:right-handed parallel beta-helix repeat-containing protein [Verrucomicrobiaceae bacterium]